MAGEYMDFIRTEVKCPKCGRYKMKMEETGMRCLHCEVIL